MVKNGKAILFGPLPPPHGGVSVFMQGLGQAVLEQGGKVWTYTGKRDRYPNDALYVDHRRFGHLIAAFRQARHGRVTDSTHFHVEYPNLVLLPLWLLAKMVLGFRWVKIIHDGSLPSRYGSFGRLSKMLFRFAIKNVDEFVAASPQIGTWLEGLGVERSRIKVIPTVLPRRGDASAEGTEALPILEKFLSSKHRICSIGTFIPSYGFHHVAEGVEMVRDELKLDIGLLLIDGLFARDDDFRSGVLKGREWITVVEDVSNEAIPKIMEKCDAFVRASEHESLGISRIEALWSGVPVIATNVGECRGMFLYEFGDIDALTRHIRTVINGGKATDAEKAALTLLQEAARNYSDHLSSIMGE
jgi:glycosyltransferase involved in cell wall biosynthesis